jgi:hypothetical protein
MDRLNWNRRWLSFSTQQWRTSNKVFSFIKFGAEISNYNFITLIIAAEKNSYSEQVWATAVALAFMGIVLADLQTTWMLVAKKAENWIRSSGKLTGDEIACTSAAQEYVKAKLSL